MKDAVSISPHRTARLGTGAFPVDIAGGVDKGAVGDTVAVFVVTNGEFGNEVLKSGEFDLDDVEEDGVPTADFTRNNGVGGVLVAAVGEVVRVGGTGAAMGAMVEGASCTPSVR